MRFQKKQPDTGSFVALFFTSLLTCFLTPASFGGAITSANAPISPPPPIIPGVIRLTCTLNVATVFHVLGEKDSKMNVAETLLDYEKADGAAHFECVAGCDNIVWMQNRREWPMGEVKPISKVTEIGQVPLPRLRMTLDADDKSKLSIETHLESAHRTWTGSIVLGKSETLVLFEPKDFSFQAEARTDENSGSTQHIGELQQLARQTRRAVTTSAWSHTQLWCSILEPGQLSKVQVAKILARPPRAGTISAKEYENATSIRNISQPYVKVLALARKLDPDHRKAILTEFAASRGSLDFLKPVAQKVREAAETNPEMTTEYAWAYIASLLGLHPMSPSGIVIPKMVPFVIAEEDSVTK